MLGLALDLSGIFSFFRIPYNSLLMDTYQFPPKTTVIGMVGAALGWNEEEVLRNIPYFKYGLIIEMHGESFNETAAIYKSKGVPIYPITKNLLYNSAFKVFLSAPTNDLLIQSAHDALLDPQFVLTLGDSENLFYPRNPHYVHLIQDLETKEKSTDRVRCILPSEIYHEYCGTFSKIHNDFLPPREIKIPVNFTGRGKNRRFIPLNVCYYSGIELQLKKFIERGAFDFDGDTVYLF